MVMCMSLVLGISAVDMSQVKAKAAEREDGVKKDTYIVSLTDNVQGESVANELETDATEEYDTYEELKKENVVVIEATEEEIKEIKKEDSVVYVEEDIILNGSKKGKSKKLTKLQKEKQKKIEDMKERLSEKEDNTSWNIEMVGADEVEDATVPKHKIKVAVIDSGMDFTEHYDVKEYINFIEEDEDIAIQYQDQTGHGTAVAGIIAGNGTGLQGMNPDVELYSLRVLDEKNQSPVSRIAEAIYWSIENDIQIINMSFGTSLNSKVLHEAVKAANKAGILMVAATGNTGGRVEYPAAYKEVMSVGSVDSQGEISEYSCEEGVVDILAPGEKTLTEGAFSGCIISSGTSMSVPHVVGAASLIWQKDEKVSSRFVKELLCKSTKKIEGSEAGILDVEYALEQYDAFKESYDENTEPEIEENDNQVETYDTTEYVEGSWGKTNHENSITTGEKRLETEYKNQGIVDVSIIRKFVVEADREVEYAKGKYSEGKYNYRGTVGLHGGGNYVANLQYLYNVAYEVKAGKSVENAIKKVKYKGKREKKENCKLTGEQMEAQLDKAILAISKNGKSNSEKCQRILALAFHLAGDIYAHETMVPKSSLDKELSGEAIVTQNYFSKTHIIASKYNKLKSAIKKNKLKFSKIKKACDKKYQGSYYEDNINFYSSRFNRGTVMAIQLMLEDMYVHKDYFDIWCLVPEEHHEKGFTINRFKIYNFAVNCCSDTLLPEEETALYKHNATESEKFE